MSTTDKNTYRIVIVSLFVFAAAFSRLFPHPYNFTPIGAMALFGGAFFSNKKSAFLLPFIAMFISDFFIGFHNTMYAVYISFLLIVFIGFRLRNQVRPLSVITASLLSSVLFFIVTNFAVWMTGELYSLNFTGLIQCYVAAIPFFGNTVAGDLLYSGILFGSFYILQQKFPQLSAIEK